MASSSVEQPMDSVFHVHRGSSSGTSSASTTRSYGHSSDEPGKVQSFAAKAVVPPQPSQPTPSHNVKKLSDIYHFDNVDAQIYQVMRDLVPMVEGSELAREETYLANVYKCDFYHHGCYYTTASSADFIEHLSCEHSNQQLCCFYCNLEKHGSNCDNEPHVTRDNPLDLVSHIQEEHVSTLQYQCNQCFYRGYSPDHVLSHQIAQHQGLFEVTMHSILEDYGTLEMDEIEVQLYEYLKATKAARVECDDGPLCRVIFCGSPSATPTDSSDLVEELRSHYVSRDVQHGLACCFCTSAQASEFGVQLLAHFALQHPAKPILFYDFEDNYPLLGTTQCTFPTDYLSTFFAKLVNTASTTPAYSDKVMQEAFTRLASPDTSGQSQTAGTKRKHEEEDGSTTEVSEAEESPEVGDQVATTTTATSPPTKRLRRLLEAMAPSDNLKARLARGGRTLLGVAATAAMAFGVYHFGHLLPESIDSVVHN